MNPLLARQGEYDRPASYYMNQGVDGQPLPTISDRLESIGMDSSIENRPMLIPVREDGEWTAPEWFHSMVRGATVPVQSVLGGTMTPLDTAMATADFAGGGLLSSGGVPENSLGMFARRGGVDAKDKVLREAQINPIEGLGPLSDMKKIGKAQIPGGLTGKFSLADLFYMKANPVDTSLLNRKDQIKLYKKQARTMEPDLNDPNERFNRLMFGQLSANTDLESSELMLSRLRVRGDEDLDKLADYIPEGKTWRTLAPAERKEISRQLKTDFNLQSRDAGGLGVASTNDFSAVAELARQFKSDPNFSVIRKGEPHTDYVERMAGQVPSIGPKTGSLSTLMMTPRQSQVGAMDRHMNEILKLDPSKIGSRDAILRLKKTGEVNPAIPEHFQNARWSEPEPSKVQLFSPEYKRGLGLLAERADETGLSPGMQQWMDWDVRRGYFAPHTQLYPGLHTKPRLPDEHIAKARQNMSNAGHWSSGKGEESHKFLPQNTNYKDIAYWGVPLTFGMGMLGEDPNQY